MNNNGRYMQKGLCLSSILSVFLILAGLTSAFDSAFAQSGIGSIEGTVTDPTGAVVPGAAIHAVNAGTHVAVDTKSNGTGFFQVQGLFTGTYDITISAPGMKTYNTSLELLVAQTAVINPKLTIGAETQQVIVNANAVQLTTNDSPSISSTLERQRINQLPENGREITTLLQETTPGLENVTNNAGGNINGLNPEALRYSVDGANLASNEFGGLQFGLTQLIDPDAVQEAHVELSNGGAQYSSPATVVMSTRSGTNRLHGTLFETARNNAFGVAKNRAAGAVTQATPQLIRNEFGVSAGGPVVIPHVYHGRNKTFFFFAYERYSLAQQTAGLASVPTYNTPGMTGPGAGMNNGDFSELINGKGVLQQLYDPATTYNSTTKCAATNSVNAYCRTPFANNQIPLSEKSPFAKVYYDIIPKPNIAGVADPLVQSNLSYNSPGYEVVDQQTARVDHEFNENNRAFIRFTRVANPTNVSSGSVPRSLAADGIPDGAALGYANNTAHTYTTATDYTHVFSPSFFAETVYSMQWFTAHHISGNDSTTDYESMLGLPNNFGEGGFPAITGLLEPLTSSQAGNLANIQINTLLEENLTKTIGRHQILFGGRFSHDRNAVKPNGLADSATFGGNATSVYQPTSGAKYTALANSGYADADMFLGSAATYHVTLEPPYVHSHLNEFDAYIQDDFHVSEKLTLNLGLRYEAHPALWTKDGLANSFDLKNDAMVLADTPAQLIAEGYTTQAIITNDENIGVKFETPQEAGFPANSLLYNYDFNFLPRLGAAWIPFRTGTIIRGGFGQYEYATPLSDYSLPSTSNNPFTAAYTQSYTSAAQAIDDLPNEQIRYKVQSQFPIAGTSASANAVNTNVTNSILPGISLSSTSPNWAPVKVDQANVTIEQPLPGRSALRVTWLYSHGANLDMEDAYNNHPTQYQYEVAYGHVFPTGTAIDTPTYSTTAPGPYDQTTWASGSTLATKNGWSNYNALQVNYQRLYHRGIAYQISYVYGKSMKAGGDLANAKSPLSKTDSSSVVEVDPDANYPGVLGSVSQMSLLPGSSTPIAGLAPPPRPAGVPVWADYHDMDQYQLYQLDANIPKMDIKFNGILDLPIGRGKWLLHNSPRWLNEIVGGFQIAGSGNVISEVFIPDSSMWGPTSQIHVYKHKVPVTDCRSGACNKGYLWFNGYLSPLVIGANCPNAPACVTGVPSNYQPYQTPINNNPAVSAYFGTEDVQLTLPGTSPTTSTGAPSNSIAYDAGPIGSNYTSKTYLNGPINWNADLSLFKVFPIKEGMDLRVNLDAFNAFNHQGDPNPGVTDGVETFLTTVGSARQLQITARFTF